jgi:hypothetical protein
VEPHDIIALSFEETGNMCANMFDVMDSKGNHYAVMSKRAKDSFSPDNWRTLSAHYRIVASEVDIIEQIGGGSCRCMLVELF